jgi:hypothetical protein
MAEAYDYGIRSLAEQLYIFSGRTYEQISEELKISQRQLERWGKAGQWRARREQYLSSKANEITRMIGVRDKIMDNLEDGLVPGTLNLLLAGYRQASTFINERLSPGQPSQVEVDKAALFLEFLQFLAEVLREANPEGLKVLSSSFDLIVGRAKERYAKTV